MNFEVRSHETLRQMTEKRERGKRDGRREDEVNQGNTNDSFQSSSFHFLSLAASEKWRTKISSFRRI